MAAQKPFEVRWHGRGGQGAKTAAYLLAEAAMHAGKFIQAFPEFGPERRGAPIRAFTRIADQPIRIRSHVYNPEVVIVLDPTLFGWEDLLAGTNEDATVLINTPLSPAEARKRFGIEGRKVFTVDATGISLQELKRNLPNIPLTGAFIKATGLVPLEAAEEEIRSHFERRYGPEVAEANVRALRRGYEEVKGE